MRHVPDLARLGRKLQKRSKATLMDAWRLYQFVQQLPALRQALEEADEASDSDFLKERLIAPLAALEQDFKTVCDLPKPMLKRICFWHLDYHRESDRRCG